jgi:hypothetical protein
MLSSRHLQRQVLFDEEDARADAQGGGAERRLGRINSSIEILGLVAD